MVAGQQQIVGMDVPARNLLDLDADAVREELNRAQMVLEDGNIIQSVYLGQCWVLCPDEAELRELFPANADATRGELEDYWWQEAEAWITENMPGVFLQQEAGETYLQQVAQELHECLQVDECQGTLSYGGRVVYRLPDAAREHVECVFDALLRAATRWCRRKGFWPWVVSVNPSGEVFTHIPPVNA